MISSEILKLLDVARQHIHSKCSINDSGSRLSLHNINIGLAKVLYVLQSLGYLPDASFFSSPDLTPPKGISKWEWGLTAGGLLSWGDGSRPLIFLDPRVSIGSALVGGFSEPVHIDQLYARIEKVKESTIKVGGITTRWDYNAGNHFINIYETIEKDKTQLPPYIFIVHGSAREITEPTKLCHGLDYQKSGELREKMKTVETPLGICRILVDKDAEKFFKQYKKAEDFALRKHQTYAEQIFGDFRLISNKIHHGYINANNVVLGCYHLSPGNQDLYPITLRPDLHSFLVRGKLRKNQKKEPASGIGEYLESAIYSGTVIPHGGGATYPHIKNILKDYRLYGGSHLILEALDSSSIIIENLQSQQSAYRGLEVIECAERNELIQIAAELAPLHSFRI